MAGRAATSDRCPPAWTPWRRSRLGLPKCLTLRSARSARLEGWATTILRPILRDAVLRTAPQNEVGVNSAGFRQIDGAAIHGHCRLGRVVAGVRRQRDVGELEQRLVEI